jgi:RimJ/RimL family protein N-acetyltransferase
MIMLETHRLRLRRITLDDVDDLHAVFSDPVAMQHYPKPFDRQMTIGWIEWNLRNYAEHGFGLWAVIHKEEDRLIGDCGLTIQRVEGVDELEIGYHILRSHWGQGYATEAAAACRDYAFDDLKRKWVISWMSSDNMASRRVAEKVGMRLEKETTNKDGDASVVYAMAPADRDDARGQR